jgi:hypothetical protein
MVSGFNGAFSECTVWCGDGNKSPSKLARSCNYSEYGHTAFCGDGVEAQFIVV